MSLKDTLNQEILEIKSNLSRRNNAVEFNKKSLNDIRSIISDSVKKSNTTSSYDEKVDCLVEGLKAVLDHQESSLVTLIKDVDRYNAQLDVLNGVLQKSSSKEETKKKDHETQQGQREQAIPEQLED